MFFIVKLRLYTVNIVIERLSGAHSFDRQVVTSKGLFCNTALSLHERLSGAHSFDRQVVPSKGLFCNTALSLHVMYYKGSCDLLKGFQQCF